MVIKKISEILSNFSIPLPIHITEVSSRVNQPTDYAHSKDSAMNKIFSTVKKTMVNTTSTTTKTIIILVY